METPLLRDADIIPDTDVLQNVLGQSYSAYEELMKNISDPPLSLVPEWNYYKDGKAWLCKVVHKKKTVFWLSVWDKFFKTGFYFTGKTGPGISGLDIDESIKVEFFNREPIGKLLPLTLEIREKEQLSDLLKIVLYKKNLK